MIEKLERAGLMKTPATMLRELRTATRDLPDLRLSPFAPDAECAALTHEEYLKEVEERERAAQEVRRAAFQPTPADYARMEAERAEYDRRRRLQETEARLVADRQGKAVVLKTADELEAERAQLHAQEQRRRESVPMYGGSMYYGGGATHIPYRSW